MINESFASVWDAIEDNPNDADEMRRRSALMMALKQHLTDRKLSPAQAAKLCGVSRPSIVNLMQGQINYFSVDTLAAMANAAGIRPGQQVGDS